ncbi:MAG: toll/interleukin-1 receptor domain-containing protein [Desulfobacteraceae bacterium]|nr:MAG: toll/interleukin-1 receptor domain-containing protein [Desulfobacteraceae bacterium]
MKNVFISYLYQDEIVVEGFIADLKSHGVEVWTDRNNIEPGKRWKTAR